MPPNVSLVRLVSVAMCLFTSSIRGQTQTACGQPFSLTGQRLTVPITVVNEFVFVQATIDGRPGKLMLDTGTPSSLILNDHLLQKLGHGKAIGRTSVSSGQSFDQTLRDCVDAVDVASTGSVAVPEVESEDLAFIEKDITPDFLGFLGYPAFSGYSFELDYALRQLTLLRGAPDKPSGLVKSQHPLATLTFTSRRRKNDPIVAVKVGGMAFTGVFDTGQAGLLEMPDADRLRLIHTGALLPLGTKDSDGEALYRVPDVELAPGFHVKLPAMVIHAPGSIADRGIGIPERKVIYLGYQVLSQFKTVWDWPNQTIYFLPK